MNTQQGKFGLTITVIALGIGVYAMQQLPSDPPITLEQQQQQTLEDYEENAKAGAFIYVGCREEYLEGKINLYALDKCIKTAVRLYPQSASAIQTDFNEKISPRLEQ